VAREQLAQLAAEILAHVIGFTPSESWRFGVESSAVPRGASSSPIARR
jgi:hypothetical protein